LGTQQIRKKLRGAKGMIDIQEKTRQQFREWLDTKAPKVQFDSLCRFLLAAEVFCLKIKVLTMPLFETTDVNTIKRFVKTVSQNKIFRIRNKRQFDNIVYAANWYYAFVRDLPNLAQKDEAIETMPATENTVEKSIVNFGNVTSLLYTKPIAFTYCGRRDNSVVNWTDLYVKLFKQLHTDYADIIPVGQSFSKNGRSDFGHAERMTAPKHIVDDYYLETNINATDIVKKIVVLIDICNISFADIVIEYQCKKIASEEQKEAYSKPDTSVDTDFDTAFLDWLKNIEKMAISTCRSYVSALHVAEMYAKEHELLNQSFSGVDWEDALATASGLMADEGFRKFNQDKHNRFSAAFQKLAKYFGYLHPDKIGTADTSAISIPEKSKPEWKTETTSTELTNELTALLKTSSSGIAREDILAHFSGYSAQQVNRALIACHAVKVLKKYYHRDTISEYSEMADILLDVLSKQFAANGNYTSAQQLYNDAHCRLDDFFFYNNAFESRPEVFDFAVHLFVQEEYKGNSFVFSSNMHIWKEEPNYPKDFHGLLIKYGREHHNIFTREEAIVYFDSIGSATPDQTFSFVLSKTGNQSFLQYAENRFVLKEAIQVTDNFLSSLRIQIGNLLEGEDYIAFGEVADYFYTTLPAVPINIQWSPLLLEDMLRIFDIGYIAIKAGKDNHKKTIPAAIMKKNSPFRTFSDIVWNEISKAYSLPKELTVPEFREFLLNKGFIHGSEKMWNVHKTVAGDLRFYWTEKNSKVTIN